MEQELVGTQNKGRLHIPECSLEAARPGSTGRVLTSRHTAGVPTSGSWAPGQGSYTELFMQIRAQPSN